MRHLLLFVMLVPMLLQAQNSERYLAGAVPVKNNKVVFSTEINVPHLSKNEIYDQVLVWAENRFNGENSRIVYTDKNKGEIAVTGKEYIIFATTALSLDRAYMSFVTKFDCSDQKCLIQTTNIRYEYNVSYQKEPEKYTAEKWITDEWALTKGNKLNRINGKFRKGTIDFVDDIAQSVTVALTPQTTINITTSNSVTVTQVPVQPEPVAVHKQEKTPLEGFISLDVNNIPQTISQMLSESTVQITIDKNEASSNTEVDWKGLGNMFGKPIASVSAEENSSIFTWIATNHTYTILFVKKEQTVPWMIMDCRKQGETHEGSQKTIIGEILQIWIK